MYSSISKRRNCCGLQEGPLTKMIECNMHTSCRIFAQGPIFPSKNYSSGSSGNLLSALTNRSWLNGSRRFTTSNISTATTLPMRTFASSSDMPSRSKRSYVRRVSGGLSFVIWYSNVDTHLEDYRKKSSEHLNGETLQCVSSLVKAGF